MQGADMLGFVTGGESGAGDGLLGDVARILAARGWPLAGAVQINTDAGPSRSCHMDLEVLSGARRIRISQDLGAHARGCRLDADALETAVAMAEWVLERGAALVIVNKFGKQELEGRGFRPLIGQALAAGVPVLTAVSGAKRAGFDQFHGGLGTELPADREAVLGWCETICAGSVLGTK